MRRGWTVRSFSAAAAPTTSRGTALFPWPLRAGHRRARSRRHDRRNLGRLVRRILAGERPLPAHASRVRLLRALSRPLRPRSAGERGQPQPAASAEDQRRRQGRLDRHAADHRHAALAADNRVNGPTAERLAALLTHSKTNWPAAKMHTTAVDSYTGERIIVSQAAAQKNGIALAHGRPRARRCPGSSADTARAALLHGCGMCSNPAHVDVVAGSKRALIITLNDGLKPPFLTGIPHPVAENIRQIEATERRHFDQGRSAQVDPRSIREGSSRPAAAARSDLQGEVNRINARTAPLSTSRLPRACSRHARSDRARCTRR